MTKLNLKENIGIKKLANEFWVIPSLLLAFFILIEAVHLNAHFKMDTDVDSYCRKFVRKNPNINLN